MSYYVNGYNCNISCLGTCFSRLVPLVAQQQYIQPSRCREPVLPGSPCAEVIYLRVYALGKGLMELSQPCGILSSNPQQPVEKSRPA